MDEEARERVDKALDEAAIKDLKERLKMRERGEQKIEIVKRKMQKMTNKVIEHLNRTENIFSDIFEEIRFQDEKWGDQNLEPSIWLAIIMEELGEAAKSALKNENIEYRKKLVQVAANAIYAIECYDYQIEIQKQKGI